MAPASLAHLDGEIRHLRAAYDQGSSAGFYGGDLYMLICLLIGREAPIRQFMR